MSNLNRVIITGRLIADPIVKYAKNEVAIAKFKLQVQAGTENKKNFIQCVAWGGLAKVCKEYLKKDRLVAVEGRLQIKGSITEVIVDNMQMLDYKTEEVK